MTDKDKLTEILNNSFAEQYEKRGLLTAQHTADDLLANGVIVAPMPMADWLKKELTEYVHKRCVEEL